MSFLGDIAGPLIGGGLGFMMGGPAGAFVGASMAGSAMSQRRANEQNIELSREQMAFQERMSNTAYQRATEDLRQAGMNPMLAYQQGGASSPGGSMPVIQSELGAGMQSAAQVGLLMDQSKKLEAEKENIDADTDRIRKTTPVSVQHTLQQIKESEEKIQLMMSQGNLANASASRTQAEEARLKAQIPEIEEHVKLMRQQIETLAQTARTSNTEEKRLQNEVKANLPAMRNQLMEIERTLLRYQEPGARMTAEAQRSILGAIDRVMRALRGRLNE